MIFPMPIPINRKILNPDPIEVNADRQLLQKAIKREHNKVIDVSLGGTFNA